MDTDPSLRIAARPGVELRVIPSGALLVDLDRGAVFELNRVGADIWALVMQARPFDRICDTLAQRYGVEADRIRADVRALLASLRSAKLIEDQS